MNYYLLLIFSLLMPVTASAHPELNHVSGALNGLLHPFSGADHLLAMFAVGLWAAQSSERSLWLIPGSFMVALSIGMALASYTMFPMAWVESGILFSLLILGLMIATALSVPRQYALPLVAGIALFHGYAHGVEGAMGSDLLLFALGMLSSTLLLHLAGMSLGLLLQRLSKPAGIQLVGSYIAMTGLFLIVT